MTTRRDVLIGAVALPLLIRAPAKAEDACAAPPGWHVEHAGPGRYRVTYDPDYEAIGRRYAEALARSMEATRMAVEARYAF